MPDDLYTNYLSKILGSNLPPLVPEATPAPKLEQPKPVIPAFQEVAKPVEFKPEPTTPEIAIGNYHLNKPVNEITIPDLYKLLEADKNSINTYDLRLAQLDKADDEYKKLSELKDFKAKRISDIPDIIAGKKPISYLPALPESQFKDDVQTTATALKQTQFNQPTNEPMPKPLRQEDTLSPLTEQQKSWHALQDLEETFRTDPLSIVQRPYNAVKELITPETQIPQDENRLQRAFQALQPEVHGQLSTPTKSSVELVHSAYPDWATQHPYMAGLLATGLDYAGDPVQWIFAMPPLKRAIEEGVALTEESVPKILETAKKAPEEVQTKLLKGLRGENPEAGFAGVKGEVPKPTPPAEIPKELPPDFSNIETKVKNLWEINKRAKSPDISTEEANNLYKLKNQKIQELISILKNQNKINWGLKDNIFYVDLPKEGQFSFHKAYSSDAQQKWVKNNLDAEIDNLKHELQGNNNIFTTKYTPAGSLSPNRLFKLYKNNSASDFIEQMIREEAESKLNYRFLDEFNSLPKYTNSWVGVERKSSEEILPPSPARPEPPAMFQPTPPIVEDVTPEMLQTPPPKPPEKPPTIPPEAPPTGGMPEQPSGSLKDRFMADLKNAEQVRESQDIKVSTEKGKRVGTAAGIARGTKGKSGMYQELKALKGEYPKEQFTPLADKYTPIEQDNLLEEIKNSFPNYFDSLNARQGFLDALNGVVPQPHQIALLEQVFPGITRTLDKLTPRLGAEKIMNVYQAALLSSPTTAIKVALSHNIMGAMESVSNMMAAGLDTIIAPFRGGTRTIVSNPSTIWSKVSGYGKGVGSLFAKKEGLSYWEGLGKVSNKLYAGIPIKEMPHIVFKNPILQGVIDSVHKPIQAAYLPNKVAAIYESLDMDARLIAKNEGLSGEAYNTRVKQLFVNPTPEMSQNAIDASEYQTFQNPNFVTDLFIKPMTKKTLSLAHQPGVEGLTGQAAYVAEKSVAPFTVVPINTVLTGIIDFTPAGIIKALSKSLYPSTFNQAAFLKDISRSVTGTSAISLGYYLFKKGLMTGSSPSDAKERATWAAEGKMSNSMKINGEWVGYNSIIPLGTVLKIGADFGQSSQEKKGLGLVATVGGEAAKGVVDMPMVQGLSRGLKALQEPERSAETFIDESVSSWIPNIVTKGARYIDPNVKNPGGLVESIGSRIPYLSKLVPNKRDIFGNPITTQGGVGIFFNPLRVSKEIHDPVIDEAKRLEAPIGYPSKSELSVKLDNREFDTYQKVEGYMIHKRLSNLLTLDGYKSLSDADKTGAFNYTLRETKKEANERLIPDLMIQRYNLPANTNPEKLMDIIKFVHKQKDFKNFAKAKQEQIIKNMLNKQALTEENQ